ncbi:hypothetical protein NIES2101_20020 [Calothrix sp. HK-06]|nr:hypothetical protein NIES2101_20020 [Calothrix sp. HK-06]
MRTSKLNLVTFASLGLLFFGSYSNQAIALENNLSLITSKASVKGNASGHKDSHGKNAQVVESGSYHLEFSTDKKTDGTHLDLYLQKGKNHEAVPNAKVTAKIQMAGGKEKSIPMKYDAKGKHYTALIADKLSGHYEVKIAADIAGQKAEGGFSFQQ